ncbi:MAG: class I SAM-dependent methyltransferase [Vicinamibacteria bacterium]
MKKRALFSVLILAGLSLFGVLAADEEVDGKELSRLIEILDVDPGESFADVGAGDGRFSVALARTVGQSGSIYATEVDPNDIQKIEERVRREKLENVEVVRGSQDETGLPALCCHGILLRRVYHHFQKPEAMQASMKRALREDGLLLVVDFGTKKSWGRPEGLPPSRAGHGMDKERLISEMEAAGFDLVKDVPWEDGDYALLFRPLAVLE